MGQVEILSSTHFEGLDRRGYGNRSDRNPLNVPRELVNMVVDRKGHLYMPRAVNAAVHTFTGEGSILAMRYIETPRGVLIQTEDNVHWLDLPTSGQWSGPATTEVAATLAEKLWKIWAVSLNFSQGALFGNAIRGTGSGGQTFNIKLDTPIDVSNVSTGLPFDGRASFSSLYKGRRFVMEKGRSVWFSDLNEHLEFGDDSTFRIGGDDGGNSFVDNPGFVQGMISWEDVLLFFLSGSVWALAGNGPPPDGSWQLTTLLTRTGNMSPWTLVSTGAATYSLMGENQGDVGVYEFTGSRADKISDPVEDLVTENLDGRGSDPHQATRFFQQYILSTPRTNVGDVQLLLYDFIHRHWTSYDGYIRGYLCPTPHGLFVSDGLTVHYIDSSQPITLPRKSGRGGKIKLGIEDENHPTGFVRWMGVKISGKRKGSGTPTITATITTQGGSVGSGTVDIPNDVFDGIVIPVNVRGHAIDLDLVITPTNDNQEVLIESVQVIYSRKGEKLSRG